LVGGLLGTDEHARAIYLEGLIPGSGYVVIGSPPCFSAMKVRPFGRGNLALPYLRG